MVNSDNDNIATSATGFARFRVCAAETGAAEWISAEAWGAGAAGVEERDSEGRVELLIYDVAGRLVRTLLSGELIETGRYESVWNGMNNAGRTVATGVYFYRLRAGDFVETKRMMLLK